MNDDTEIWKVNEVSMKNMHQHIFYYEQNEWVYCPSLLFNMKVKIFPLLTPNFINSSCFD